MGLAEEARRLAQRSDEKSRHVRLEQTYGVDSYREQKWLHKAPSGLVRLLQEFTAAAPSSVWTAAWIVDIGEVPYFRIERKKQDGSLDISPAMLRDGIRVTALHIYFDHVEFGQGDHLYAFWRNRTWYCNFLFEEGQELEFAGHQIYDLLVEVLGREGISAPSRKGAHSNSSGSLDSATSIMGIEPLPMPPAMACRNCGEVARAPRCPQCGARADATYCSNCGALLDHESTTYTLATQYTPDGKCRGCGKYIGIDLRTLHPRYCSANRLNIEPPPPKPWRRTR